MKRKPYSRPRTFLVAGFEPIEFSGAREFGGDEPPPASGFELTPFRLVLPMFFDEVVNKT